MNGGLEIGSGGMSRFVLLAILLATSACGPTLIALESYQALDEVGSPGAGNIERLASDESLTKPDVLALLGPPVSVIGQPDGDVFVYRRVARDRSSLNLNPAYVVPVAPPVPVYTDVDVTGRDDLLLLFFDVKGQVRGASLRHSIGVGTEGPGLHEVLRAWLR